MKPDAYFDALEKQLELAVRASLGESAPEIRQLIRKDLPSARTKTRHAVRVRTKKSSKGFKSLISLKFAKKYRSRNTKTASLFREAVTRQTPAIRNTIHRNLTRTEKGL